MVRTQIDIQGTCGGQPHGQQEACPQRAEGRLIVVCARLTGHIFRDGGLYAGDGEREGERKDGSDQLIDAHAFGAEHVGQEDAIEKADKAAEKSGQGEDDGSGHQRMI